jgi:hypothetical protein
MKRSVVMLSMVLAMLGLSCGAWAAKANPLDPATIAAAKTPAQHEAIAKAYEAEAAALEKTAEMHKNMAQTYGQPGGKPWQAAQAKHCDNVTTSLKAAAEEERALAAEHHKMATTAGQ